ncbi:LacI family DNA-binding transcriptional regulator [Pelagovum pacificum]|uniref:Substrate-binding domain-containing protein n=1 Tax=Pelagovum pacificum TaxID=2588711 RepID=A0A5C5GEQ4_9RHOB|nr:LacI family DNA-binding transcriptional regulator [Pelagovum pacificum]QQA43879.1 LacI family DNA-binding transcriptional regulator [Pelagovum pacificum]TNY32990.1 substrate-binding domain-containing protein [Pelagovum pacificum]
MGDKPVTSVDVARKAGVSQSAVSRFFTPGASVSKKMAERIRVAAEELGYRPNVLARSLITGKSRIVGLVVHYLENQFYPEVVERLSIALQDQGYHVLLFMAQRTVGDVEDVVQRILDYRVDALVLVSVSMSSTLTERCVGLSIPVMLFNRDQPGSGLRAVTSDNRAGGRLAAEALLAGGLRRIAHLRGFEDASTDRDRADGFCAALAEAGVDVAITEFGDYHYDTACEATRRIFDRTDRPDALFVADDHMAFAALDVIRTEFGLSVPGDVAVVGFDDAPAAAWPSFDLTTVRQDRAAMVAAAVAATIGAIEGDETGGDRQLALPVTLVTRGSTRRG